MLVSPLNAMLTPSVTIFGLINIVTEGILLRRALALHLTGLPAQETLKQAAMAVGFSLGPRPRRPMRMRRERGGAGKKGSGLGTRLSSRRILECKQFHCGQILRIQSAIIVRSTESKQQ